MPTTLKTLPRPLLNVTNSLCAIVSTHLEMVIAFWMKESKLDEVSVLLTTFEYKSLISVLIRLCIQKVVPTM